MLLTAERSMRRQANQDTLSLLIRSYRRAPAQFNQCSSVCVRMPAHGSCSARGLLYPLLCRMTVASELAEASRSQLMCLPHPQSRETDYDHSPTWHCGGGQMCATLSSRPAMIELVDLFVQATFSGDIQPGPDDLFASPQPLFTKEDFNSVLADRSADMVIEIRKYPANKLLNVGTERLLDYFYSKYSIDVPVLDEQNRSVQHHEVHINVVDPASGESKHLAGFRYKITVPFSGDPRVFNSRPPDITDASQPPIALIDSAALVFSYDLIDLDEAALKASHSHDLAVVKQYLGWLADEVDVFDQLIREYGAEEIQARRARILKAHGVAASLGIRLERAGLPATYAAPQVQRKPHVVQPKASARPYVPEPALEEAEYDYILDVIRATTLVVERNPSTFAAATEPLIRDHFLVQLNGHYKGQATGETFNSYGKSDILVRAGDKNIFLAEVKFWDGQRSITNALRQLLTRYATWRDSKIALIILNRRRNFSAVLDQVPGAIEAYENTIRRLKLPSGTDFRYLLQHPDDPNKGLLLTVMCFEVPAKLT